MKKGTIIAGLSALLGLMLFVIFRYSPVAARQLTQDDPEKPQIAMVIDVSNSMSAYLFPSELPGDLKLIQDRIKEVEGSEDFIQLSAALKAIDEDPDVIQAIEAYQSAVAAAEVWITENGFGSQNELERQISSTLSDMGCNSGFADDLFDAENMAAVDILISQACEGAVGSENAAEAIKSQIPFLEDPDYAALRSKANERWATYIGTRNMLGYEQTNAALGTFLAFTSYEDVKRELNIVAEDLGFSTRLKHAKLAASTILDLARLDNKARNRETVISLEQFSTIAKHLSSLTTDYEMLRSIIAAMEPIEFTNIGGGLTLALDEIEKNGDIEQSSAIILLSDGHANRGMTRDEMLDKIPERALELNTRICAVGFGNEESEVDFILLRGLAEATDGAYLFAKTGDELIGFFVACQQALISDAVEQFNGIAAAGETIEAGRVDVLDNTAALNFTLTYLTGSLDLVLTDPSGEIVDDNYSGALIQDSSNVQLVSISEPKPGEWVIQVRSSGTAVGSNVYSIAVSTELKKMPTQEPTLAPVSPVQDPQVVPSLLVGLGILLLLGIPVLIILLLRKGINRAAVIAVIGIILLAVVVAVVIPMLNPQVSQPVSDLLNPSETYTITPDYTPTATATPTPLPPTATSIPSFTPTPIPLALDATNIDRLESMRGPIQGLVLGLTISPDGKILAYATWDGWSTTMEEHRFQIQLSEFKSSGATIPLYSMLGHTDYLRGVAFPASRGDIVASISEDRTARLWNVSDGSLLGVFDEESEIYSMALSPEGDILAVGLKGSGIRVYNTQDQALITELNSGKGPVTSLAISPDGSMLVSASAVQNDFTIRLWDTTTWRETRRLGAHLDIVANLVFSPDSTLLASGSYDTTARLYDAANGRLLFELSGHNDHVAAVAFSPGGELLATGSSDKILRIWQVSDGALLKEYPVEDRITALAFSPNGAILAVGELGQLHILGIDQ